MKKSLLPAFGLLVLALGACSRSLEERYGEETASLIRLYEADSDYVPTKYDALVGDWEDLSTNDSMHFFEQWRPRKNGAMDGRGFTLAGRDTVFKEELRLNFRSERGIVYGARLPASDPGEWTPFFSRDAGGDSLVFENSDHDWPQHIIYVRNVSGWDVTVSGREHGVERQEHFHLVKHVR